jgi:DNA-directed RNA polymerase specialized sigma24 family protein
MKYIRNKDLIREIKKYHKLGKISRDLHEMFYLLSERVARKSLFYRRIKEQNTKSEDIDECYRDVIHEGYVKCLIRINSFSLEHKNPFSYFTSVIINAFKDFFSKEKRYDILKMIEQTNYDHRFLMKYGFKPIHNIDEE